MRKATMMASMCRMCAAETGVVVFDRRRHNCHCSSSSTTSDKIVIYLDGWPSEGNSMRVMTADTSLVSHTHR